MSGHSGAHRTIPSHRESPRRCRDCRGRRRRKSSATWAPTSWGACADSSSSTRKTRGASKWLIPEGNPGNMPPGPQKTRGRRNRMFPNGNSGNIPRCSRKTSLGGWQGARRGHRPSPAGPAVRGAAKAEPRRRAPAAGLAGRGGPAVAHRGGGGGRCPRRRHRRVQAGARATSAGAGHRADDALGAEGSRSAAARAADAGGRRGRAGARLVADGAA